jgi:hypothetical protein
VMSFKGADNYAEVRGGAALIEDLATLSQSDPIPVIDASGPAPSPEGPSKDEADALYAKLRKRIHDAWVTEFQERCAEVDNRMLSGVYLAALIDMAAAIGVDIGMATDPFVEVCRGAWERGNADAPRFG